MACAKPTIWGYPLTASVQVDDERVDVSSAFVFDPFSRSGIVRLDEDAVLRLIEEAQHQREDLVVKVQISRHLLSEVAGEAEIEHVADLAAAAARTAMRARLGL